VDKDKFTFTFLFTELSFNLVVGEGLPVNCGQFLEEHLFYKREMQDCQNYFSVIEFATVWRTYVKIYWVFSFLCAVKFLMLCRLILK
jgi:hypothetical protein